MRERHWPRAFGRKAGQNDKSGGVALARAQRRAQGDAAMVGPLGGAAVGPRGDHAMRPGARDVTRR